MELKDNWYKNKQIYSINYRPLKRQSSRNSNLVIETVRFNPSVCTCEKHCSEPHYRVESRVINIADRVDIKDSMAFYYERYSSNMKRGDKIDNENDPKMDISVVLSESKNCEMKSGNGVHQTVKKVESKSIDAESLTSADIDVSSDGGKVNEEENRVRVIGSVRITKSYSEGGNVKVNKVECVDKVKEIRGSVAKVEEFNVFEFEHNCGGNKSRSEVKCGADDEFVNVSKVVSIDDVTGNDSSVKNGSENEHFNFSYVEFKDDVTRNDISVKNSTWDGELHVRKAEYQGGVFENKEDIKQSSDDCEDISVTRRDDAVVIASRSCVNQNDDHDTGMAASGNISSGSSDADERGSNVVIEEIFSGNTDFLEDISAAFGIMSVYCNSELHSFRKNGKEVDTLERFYKL